VRWFVPPLLVPCVEVIAAPATDAQVVERVVSVLRRLGKTPVTVGDGPAFVANRIQFVMFREAARIVEAGLATPAHVDEVVRSSFGFRLPFFGPFTIADLVGLDVYADIHATLERELGDDFHVPAAVEERVANGGDEIRAAGGEAATCVGRSFARIFFRNCANLGLASVRCRRRSMPRPTAPPSSSTRRGR
jgi:3-hydroxybutyryl-CoA dehydrogenase